MSVLRNIPYSEVVSNLCLRTSVTVSWPIRRGRDFLKWKECPSSIVDEIRDNMEAYEKSTRYRSEYNFKIQKTKSNVAKLMGMDPKFFSDDEFKLSLLYLLPSDIEKEHLKPKIPEQLPVRSILDIIAQYSSDKTVSGTSLKSKKIREKIRLIHSINLHAMKHAETAPDLESNIDCNENISLPRCVDEEVDEDSSSEASQAFQIYPFVPKSTQDKDADTVLNLQFLKLNEIIQDRPDLIKTYYPVVRNMIIDVDGEKVSLEHSKANQNQDAEAVFRAKVSRVYLFNSVETTMVPGSGKISINGESYLDFFLSILSRMTIISPLRLTQTLGVFDIDVRIDQEEEAGQNKLAHCIAMSVADCLQQYEPSLRDTLAPVYKKSYRVEYKKAGKKNSRARYKWRKR